VTESQALEETGTARDVIGPLEDLLEETGEVQDGPIGVRSTGEVLEEEIQEAREDQEVPGTEAQDAIITDRIVNLPR